MFGIAVLFIGMTLFFYCYFSDEKPEASTQKREKAEKVFFSGIR